MSGDLQKALGRNLRKRREAMGLSQEKFAEHLGFHRTYAGALERGERNISLKSLETLGELLGVDPRDLLQE
jgi:transcriptional regulator with XRE-family HTH domain